MGGHTGYRRVVPRRNNAVVLNTTNGGGGGGWLHLRAREIVEEMDFPSTLA